jgi:hypothetical protein
MLAMNGILSTMLVAVCALLAARLYVVEVSECARAEPPARTTSAEKTTASSPFDVDLSDADFFSSEIGGYKVALGVRHADRRHSRNMTNITLVTHVTADRAARLALLCSTWRGPMSVSVYVRPSDTAASALATIAAAGNGCVAKHAELHLVQVADGTESRPDMYANYPFNVQRNTATDGAIGKWVLVLDADFEMLPKDQARERVVSQRFHDLRHSAVEFGDSVDDKLDVVAIIPALETVTKTVEIPRTFSDLSAALRVHEVCAFYGHYCKACHRPSNVERYAHMASQIAKPPEGQAPQQFRPYLVKYEEGFEPYAIMYRPRMPRYDERFIGRGFDKMSFFFEVARQNRRFVVLPPPLPYLVHAGRGDLPTNYTQEYLERQRRNVNLNEVFKARMKARYGGGGGSAYCAPATAASPSAGAPPAVPTPGPGVEGGSRVTPTPHPGRGAPGAHRPAAQPLAAPTAAAAATHDAVTRPLIARPTIDQIASIPTGTSQGCVAAWRTEELDEDRTRRLEGALSFACQRIDCAPLHLAGVRRYPDTLVAHADWAMHRYHLLAVQGGEAPEQACHFGGAAKLVMCAPTCQACGVPDGTPVERLGAALEWVCGPDGLQNCGEVLHGLGVNTDTATVAERAATLFTHFFSVHRCMHHDPSEACHFGGAGTLIDC